LKEELVILLNFFLNLKDIMLANKDQISNFTFSNLANIQAFFKKTVAHQQKGCVIVFSFANTQTFALHMIVFIPVITALYIADIYRKARYDLVLRNTAVKYEIDIFGIRGYFKELVV